MEKKKKFFNFFRNSFFQPKSSKVEDEVEDIADGIPSPMNYNPSKQKYHPINDACWKKDEKYVHIMYVQGSN